MLRVAALRNSFTYGKLFHQLEEIVSELLRYLWEIPSDAHQSLSRLVGFLALPAASAAAAAASSARFLGQLGAI